MKIITNLLFSCGHIYQGIYGCIYSFVLGILMSIEYKKRNNIYTIDNECMFMCNWAIIVKKPNCTNGSEYAPPPLAAPEFRSARSFRYAPFSRLTPPTFCHTCASQCPLSGLSKRRKQPERYVQCLYNCFKMLYA
jgi:hypothetical protein